MELLGSHGIVKRSAEEEEDEAEPRSEHEDL